MLSVKTQELSKTFSLPDDSVKQDVIKDVNLEVAAGESVAFMGPSGSGKSTLLNLIAGLEEPSSGKIFLGNLEITSMSSEQKTKNRLNSISYVFQFFHLLPTLTALENCALIGIEQGVRDVNEIIDDAISTLRFLGLQGSENKRPSQLSGGMQARVALARALVARPKLILADEPTGNLDSKSGMAVMDFLFQEQMKRKFTLLMVTHDESAAKRAERVLLLRDGQLQT